MRPPLVATAFLSKFFIVDKLTIPSLSTASPIISTDRIFARTAEINPLQEAGVAGDQAEGFNSERI
jgi:hypothetical protein